MELHRSAAQLQRWLLSASMAVVLGGFALQTPEAMAAEPSNNTAVIAQPNVEHQNWDYTVASTEMGSELGVIGTDSGNYRAASNSHPLPGAQQPASSYHNSCRNGTSPYPDSMFGYGQNFHSCP